MQCRFLLRWLLFIWLVINAICFLPKNHQACPLFFFCESRRCRRRCAVVAGANCRPTASRASVAFERFPATRQLDRVSGMEEEVHTSGFSLLSFFVDMLYWWLTFAFPILNLSGHNAKGLRNSRLPNWSLPLEKTRCCAFTAWRGVLPLLLLVYHLSCYIY